MISVKLNCIICSLLVFSFVHAQGLLPIYSEPMVFLNQKGNVVGTVPVGHWLINRTDGGSDNGWAKGMAGNTVAESGLIPIVDYSTNEVKLINQAGETRINFGKQYRTISPAYEGFHLARKVTKESYFEKITFFYLDSNGNLVFNPNGYEKATVFHNGLAPVKTANGWRYLDTKGVEHNLLDTSFKAVHMVSPFVDGLSKVMIGPAARCNYSSACYQFVFIDAKGKTVLDTRTLFPGDTIYEMSEFYHGISVISFGAAKRSGPKEVVFINKKGEVLMRFHDLRGLPEFKNGYAAINTEKKTDRGTEIDSVYLVSPDMKRTFFKAENGFQASEVYDVDEGYFEVVFWKDKEGMSKLYHAPTGKYISLPKEDVMGVNGNLLSMRNSVQKRYYVIDIPTGKIIYDTKVGDQLYSNIEGALDFPLDVTRYRCSDKSDLPYLNQLVSLQELTLHHLDIETFPAEIDPPSLEILRLDGLMQLKSFPVQITGLKKLSLRDCVSASNLMDFLKLQKELHTLYLINFDLTQPQVDTIKSWFPNAALTISGNAKLAHSQIQEYIDGF